MSRSALNHALTLVVVLSTATGAAVAAGSAADAPPRYTIHGSRVQPAPSHVSADGRYTLDARLKQASDTSQHGSGIALHATLTSAPGTACSVAGDLIFANGFQ